MANRDVEIIRSRAKFVATLRRVAAAIEEKQPVRIQVGTKRFTIPADAKLSIEHEVEDGDAELELQLRWLEAEPALPPKRKRATTRRSR